MKTTTFTQPNYRSNYIAMQLQLPMEIEKVIDPKDELYSFAEAMKGIDLSQYLKKRKHRGNPGYCPTMMFNVMMFAEMEGKNSDLRELEKLCKTDLRYMLLSREQTPSHMAFQRFEQNVLKKAMREIFAEIAEHLCDQMGVNREIQYIDGTKLEANAYKNSFVYKTRVLHARERLNERVTEAIIQLNQKYGYAYPYHWNYASQEIGYIAQYLMEVMVREGIPIQYGRGKRKTEWQQEYDEFLGYAMKL
ncbi:transposase, partial [Bacteroides ovatus]